MLKGKKKFLFLFASTFIVLGGLFTVRTAYEVYPDHSTQEIMIEYGKYVKHMADVFINQTREASGKITFLLTE